MAASRAYPVKMSSDWTKAKEIFNAALDLEGEAREEYLNKACRDDHELRREVDSLLSSFDDAGDFLNGTPTHRHATRLAPRGQVGNYVIVRHLSSGGMGEVYLAKDPRLDRTVVLKFLADILQVDESARKRFLHEARMASAVDHPNICTIYEISRHGEADVIAMQYIGGRSLKEELADGPLEIGRVLDIASQIAAGLSAAHEAGIIHRDLKPANIMITPKGRIIILDFGLAKPSDTADKSQLTQSGMIIGTPAYMSPEQVKSGTLDPRSDIFSFGAVLYEMTVGRSAFSQGNKTTVEVLHAVVYDEPEPIDAAGEPARDGLAGVIEKCLKKDQSERYATVDELSEDLADVDATQITRAVHTATSPTTTPGTLLTNVILPQRRLLAIVAGVVVLFAAGLLGYRQFSTPVALKAPPRSIIVLPLKNLTGDAANDYLSDGITESVIDSLSKLSELRIIPRSASFRYRDGTVDPVAIGKQLGIDGVLEGSLQNEGDALRIGVRMISTSDGSVLWSNIDFRGSMREIFALQDEIANGIAARLQIPTGLSRPGATPNKTDPEAYRLYLQGRFYWNQLTQDGLEKSIQYYELAIQKNPNFALAQVGLADSYIILAMDFAEPRLVLPKARAAATKALELDESLAAAHISMGSVKLFLDWDWAGARAEANRARELSSAYRDAMEINTQYGDSHHFYCGFLEAVGEADSAVDEIGKARELDPFSSMLTYELGLAYYVKRRYDDALALADEMTSSVTQGSPYGHPLRAQVLEQQGRYDEAIASVTSARNGLADTPLLMSELGYSYGKMGRTREADAVLAGLQRRSANEFIDPYYVAVVYLGLGKKGEALNWLEKATEAHSFYVTFINVDPKFDELKSEERFHVILRRIGLA